MASILSSPIEMTARDNSPISASMALTREADAKYFPRFPVVMSPHETDPSQVPTFIPSSFATETKYFRLHYYLLFNIIAVVRLKLRLLAQEARHTLTTLVHLDFNHRRSQHLSHHITMDSRSRAWGRRCLMALESILLQQIKSQR